MSLFGFIRKKPAALLSVFLDGVKVCEIHGDELPCERTPSAEVHPGSVATFVDSNGTRHEHGLGQVHGWAHLSVRVHANRACQADCVVSRSPQFDVTAAASGDAVGIRFQPFFLPGSNVPSAELTGKGLFARGLHFSGTITPGYILLSCECDQCHRSFLIRSYHAGFSNCGYFYSASGKHTLTVPNWVSGSPAALSEPDPIALAELEARLPDAPDGSRYSYLNPFRCPHCGAAYIDFQSHPQIRPSEYYGNYFADAELLRFESSTPEV